MAQVTRVTWGSTLQTLINDNSSKDITAAEVRTVLQNLADSVAWYTEAASVGHDHAGVYSPVFHAHAASDITSGVFPVARLGTGTPSGANFLSGDGTFKTPPGGGDMVASTYDPSGIAANAFNRANHTGSQPISSVSGLQTALDGKAFATNTPTITFGEGAPSSTPGKVGDVYVDTENENIYTATGNESSDDWTIGSGGGGAWGSISGTLADQTDLQAALDGKATSAQGALADSAVQPGDAVTALDGTAHRLIYVDGSGNVTELAFGSAGTVLQSGGAAAAPNWGTAGAGNVTKDGTPQANRMAYWIGDGQLGHEAGFTYDPGTDTLSVAKVVIGGIPFDGNNQLADPDVNSLLGWDDLNGTATWYNSRAILNLLLADALEPKTLTSGTTITIDFDDGVNFKVDLAHDTTFANPSNQVPGLSGSLEVTQAAGGPHTGAFGDQWYFSGGVITLSTGEGDRDLINFYTAADGRIHVVGIINLEAAS